MRHSYVGVYDGDCGRIGMARPHGARSRGVRRAIYGACGGIRSQIGGRCCREVAARKRGLLRGRRPRRDAGRAAESDRVPCQRGSHTGCQAHADDGAEASASRRAQGASPHHVWGVEPRAVRGGPNGGESVPPATGTAGSARTFGSGPGVTSAHARSSRAGSSRRRIRRTSCGRDSSRSASPAFGRQRSSEKPVPPCG